MSTTRPARPGHSGKSSRQSWPSRIALFLAMAALAVLPPLRGSWHHGVLLLLVFVALEPAVLGFDTGHHADLTREVLHEAGFGETSIRVAQVQNWLVDYYSASPTGQVFGLRTDLARLHCDTLLNAGDVNNYWSWLAVNAKKGVQQAAAGNDPLKCITLLGASLHAVQDFYAHSNWTKLHPPGDGPYRTETWFDLPREGPFPDMYTGWYPERPRPAGGREPHGGYTHGLNHDSYGRPRWDEAYVFAFVASRRWVAATHQWTDEVDPTFWGKVQAYHVLGRDAADLALDVEASIRISEWIKGDGADGHWKGSGSGSRVDLVAFLKRWLPHDSRFVLQFKKLRVHQALITNLRNDGGPIPAAAGPLPAFPAVANDRRAILIRTYRAKNLHPRRFGLVKANFFARVTVDGQEFVEGMRLHDDIPELPWTTIKFVPTSALALPIRYELWNEGGSLSGPDRMYAINPQPGRKHLEFTFDVASHRCSGDLAGIHDGPSSAAIAEAPSASDGARVELSITERALR